MNVLYRHIFVFVLIVAMSFDSLAQDRRSDDMSVRLAEYETLCRECLELKTKAAAGERVSRDEAQALLNDFVEANRALKDIEPAMTVVQRQRFAAVGQWFSTGNPPQEPDQTFLQMAHIPTRALIGPSAQPLARKNVDLPENVRPSIFALVDMSIPDLSYGLMAGCQYERIGGYLRFRTDFRQLPSISYECLSNGNINPVGKFWASGSISYSNMFMTAGILVPVKRYLTIYAGAGYGNRTYAWEDIEGSWALVSDLSNKGLAVDAGVIFSWRRLAVSAGISTISFKTAAFTCGIGVRL